MAFVLRGLGRSLPSIRPACLGTTRWQAPDGNYYSSEGSKVPDEAEDKIMQKNKAKHKREEAKLKLNSLLESIEKHQTVAPPSGDRSSSDLSSRLARPGARPRPREVVPNKKRSPAAAAAAAATARAAAPPVRQPTLDEQVAAAAREVASSMSGDPAETERDLLSKLSEDQDQPSAGQMQFSELMSSMKVEQQPAARSGRAEHIRHQVGGQRADTLRQARHDRPRTAPRSSLTGGAADDVDLKSGDVLGIFTDMKPADAATEVTPGSAPTQWEQIHARELRLSVAHPPANAWEEMAVWTEQGKLWHLPVNNEQGREEEEASVGFHEHVFLERHLEPWCPPRGPIRQFMELVCVALGKNPWLSIQEKHEHIDWFREYFAGKQKLLQELKAV